VALGPQPSAETLYRHAEALEQAGDLDGAIESYREAILWDGGSVEGLFNLAGLLADRGSLVEAIDQYRQAANLYPDVPEVHHGLGAALARNGDHDEAAACLTQAITLRPDFAEAHFELGNANRALGRLNAAAENFHAAIAARPDYAEAHLNLAGTLQELGRFAEAEPLLRRAVDLDPELSQAHYQILTNRKITNADRPELERLDKLLARAGTPDTDRVNLGFALGKSFDDLGEPDRAFGYFAEANRLKRAASHYDPAAVAAQFAAIAGVFDQAFLAARAGWGERSKRPVFILGMPRSGTTLVEQILASHPQAFGAGELPVIGRMAARLQAESGAEAPYPEGAATLGEAAVKRLARQYLKRLEDRDATAARVSDKMPANFIHLGLIALMFPEAAVIHCRRDPVDTCLSCYFQNFTLPLPFAYDLGGLGRYFADYERLMAHWRAALPRPPLEVEYEALIADQEDQSRRIVAHCGLDWDPRCLAFHETERAIGTASVWQVRQPIYRSSVRKWRRYEAHLGPLLEALGPGRVSGGAP
jgi:tetratricopeptide (TPR) repeat protein